MEVWRARELALCRPRGRDPGPVFLGRRSRPRQRLVESAAIEIVSVDGARTSLSVVDLRGYSRSMTMALLETLVGAVVAEAGSGLTGRHVSFFQRNVSPVV
jgi:hypothetical protein